jgi:hypothetical protein
MTDQSEAGSRALRRVVQGFLLAAALSVAGGIWASAATDDWMWFARSGAVMTALGLVLASRKILPAPTCWAESEVPGIHPASG